MSADRYARYVLSFERSLRAHNRSPNTIYSYLNCLKSAERFLTAHGQARHTAERGDLESYLVDLLGRYKPSLVEIHHRALTVFTAG